MTEEIILQPGEAVEFDSTAGLMRGRVVTQQPETGRIEVVVPGYKAVWQVPPELIRKVEDGR